jgi:G3E family GTPase
MRDGSENSGDATVSRIPVIAVTGHLGAGKTTVLNHLLRRPGARVGVVVNDFGDINVDAGLLVGQIDEPASIGSGCICCLPDGGGLDEALHRLSRPRLALDAILVEASGVADPGILADKIRASRTSGIRPGGVVDVVDAVHQFDTVDLGGTAPRRYAAATLVVVNKVDQLPPAAREETLRRITARIRDRTPRACIVPNSRGRVDPRLVFDVASDLDDPGELPLRALLRGELVLDHPGTAGSGTGPEPPDGHDTHGGNGGHNGHDGHCGNDGHGAGSGHDTHDGHAQVRAVTVSGTGPVDPGPVVDLLEDPPVGVYRLKGTITVHTRSGPRRHVVELVGSAVHVRPAPRTNATSSELVAIGPGLDTGIVRQRLERALHPASGTAVAPGLRRLQRHQRLSR